MRGGCGGWTRSLCLRAICWSLDGQRRRPSAELHRSVRRAAFKAAAGETQHEELRPMCRMFAIAEPMALRTGPRARKRETEFVMCERSVVL